MDDPLSSRNLVSLCEVRAQLHFDEKLFSFLDRDGNVYDSITYGQLYTRACAIGAMLQSMGQQGRPLVLWYSHDRHFVEAFYGAILGSAIPMPMTKPRGGSWIQLESAIVASGARVVLTVSSMAAHFPAKLRVQHNLRIECTDVVGLAHASEWVRPDIYPEDTAFIQYTSGSTSKPKGVTITHANIMHNVALVRRCLALTSRDVGVSWLPFFHDMGLINHVIQPLYSKIHNYHMAPLHFAAKPSRWLDAIMRYRGTISGGPNFAYELCLTKIPDAARFNLSSWRIAYCGSERVSGDTMTAFQESFSCAGFSSRAFFPCYGLAEATLFVCGTHCCRSISLPSGTESYVRVGELQKDSSIVVVEPISEHRIQADRVVGEIWMKSPSVAPGYYQDEDQTGSTFERTCAAGNGYLRTGDLGFTHDGGLYFVSRLKNLMKVRGRSFFAEDIETHVARVGAPIGIKRCVAFSIERNSGEAMIILMEGDENINSNAAIATVRSSMCDTFDLDPYAIKIAPKNSLPLTTSGKLQRSICRNQFIEGLYD